MGRGRARRCTLGLAAAWLGLGPLTAGPALAQDYGGRLGSVTRGGQVSFEPTGPGVLYDALDPAVRKWFVPQELYNEYRWQQWEYTNYARTRYERYVDINLQGSYFYDIFGRFVSRGWLVYDWRQETPRQFGSTVFKTSRYSGWFSNVLIAADSRGQYYYALTIGDEIRTTLTPLTFSKPAFNGLQWDFASDKYQATLLMARPSRPAQAHAENIPDTRTSATNLLGGRATARVGDFATVGATYVTAYQTQTLLEDVAGNPFTGGALTTDQNALPVSRIVLRLSDDSPEDGTGGAALFDDEIMITDLEGNVVRGSAIRFTPTRQGGLQRVGYLAADGDEQITLTYDFTDPAYMGPDRSVIRKVAFELVISNDYRVEATSDRQTNAESQPVFLLVDRAAGNIQDNSNQRVLRFEYGLPTSNAVYGLTVEAMDVGGFDFYGEYDANRRYRQYPNVNLDDHRIASSGAHAWMVNLSRKGYPFFGFFEAFSVESDYTTRSFLAGTRGQDEIDYADAQNYVYEFVDDNDDQDRRPDWSRVWQPVVDNAVFPGWDENNDFISDFNQNDTEDRENVLPDYDEPFLRYHTDRPEFLFGIDMNNNGWIDRFENDEEADYPYGLDHQGYNVYVGAYLAPEARLTAGLLREELISGDGESDVAYALLTFDRDFAGLGRLRLFESLRRAQDDIPDDLLQWVQPPNSRGTLQRILDPLPARDTWVNTAFARLDWRDIADLNIINKVKVETYSQRQAQSGLRELSSFVGIVNKADYTVWLGRVTVEPRWKSEFLRERPFRSTDPARRELTETGFLLARFPVLRQTLVELGLEVSHFEQLRDDAQGVPYHRSLSPDANSRVLAFQFSNTSDYVGYKLNVRAGFRLQKRTFETQPSSTTSAAYMTVYAGL
ncbi:MAG: hypothetical protein AB1505_00555 [Candidatus Latescibacterota bacterium]